MPDIVHDLSDTTLRRTIKDNLYDLFRLLQRSPDTRFFEDSDMLRWKTPLPHSFFDGILSLKKPGENPSKCIQDTISFFQSQGVDSFSWWLESDMPVSSWEGYLLSHGFFYDVGAPRMAVELEKVNQMVSLPAGLTIQSIKSVSLFHEWISTFIEGFGFPGELEKLFHDFFLGVGIDLPIQYYLGFLNGTPVATSTLFFGAGVAGIYNVSTLPEARRQGIGAAMTRVPLLDARGFGYKAGILHSSKLGYPIYQSIGFKELCKMDHFLWAENHQEGLE